MLFCQSINPALKTSITFTKKCFWKKKNKTYFSGQTSSSTKVWNSRAFFFSYLALFIFWNSGENNLIANSLLQSQAPGMSVKRNSEVEVSVGVQALLQPPWAFGVDKIRLRAASIWFLQNRNQKNQKQEELFQWSKDDRQKEKSSLLIQIIQAD